MSLDGDQLDVIQSSSTSKVVVVAQPGAGKTRVVVERAIELARADPDSDVLVISFSNAAVGAVRDRAAGARLLNLWVGTLDALALRLVHAAGVSPARGFDAIVQQAINLCVPKQADLGVVSHILVDEAQDLDSLRGKFLAAILQAAPSAGATVVGDPLQKIYDFEADSDTGAFLDDLLRDATWSQKVLPGSYRAKSQGAHRAVALRRSLSTLIGDYLGELPEASMEDMVARASASSKSIGILTRTNAEAAMLSMEMGERGLPTGVTAKAEAAGVTSLVALTLGQGPAQVTKQDFMALTEDRTDGEILWSYLRRLAGTSTTKLRVTDVVTALALAQAAPAALRSDPYRRTISTVHRAKGLEFLNTYLASPTGWRRLDDSREQWERLAYVAVTRAERFSFRLQNWETGRRWMLHQRTGRSLLPAGRFGIGGISLDARDALTREVLPEKFRRGQDWLQAWTTPMLVEARLNRARSDSQVPIYDLLAADETLIGRTSASFGQDLASCIGRRKDSPARWPELGPVTVDGVLTDFRPQAPADMPVGRHGLWLAARLSGGVRLLWKESK